MKQEGRIDKVMNKLLGKTDVRGKLKDKKLIAELS